MTPYFADEQVTLYAGNCRTVLADVPADSVDAIVTDPPYELGFMARSWDSAGVAFDPATWAECLRVLKPGGHLLAFGGTRTYHRMAVAIEDAGFEIRDSMHWVYGSGFPKSLDVSKAIDKAAGAKREVVRASPFASRKPRGTWTGEVYGDEPLNGGGPQITAPATDDAARWQGWGTALKPGHEPIVVARKPLAGTVAGNILAHGTGALNVDACRVGWDAESLAKDTARRQQPRHDMTGGRLLGGESGAYQGDATSPAGRWPTNLVFTHSAACNDGSCAPDCPVAELNQQSGVTKSSGGKGEASRRTKSKNVYSTYANEGTWSSAGGLGDTGGASRFFPVFRYEAKAPASERPRGEDGTAHVTVKPLALMRWLVRLVTPPGGLILDPFLGSGTTAEAAVIEGFRCIGVELDEKHLPLIKARLSKPIQPALGFEDAS